MAPKNAKIAPKSHNNEKIAQKTLVTAVTLQYLNVLSAAAEFVPPLPDEMVQAAKQGKMTFEPRGITAQDTVVFVIGMIPFFWATNEFWRRIAAGEPFGTGDGSVVIRPDDATTEVKGSPRRVLTSGAMNLAYFLFAAVGVTGALVAAAVVQAAKI